MVLRSSRGRPINAPASFIHPCQPTVASKPPIGPGWAHELKHDGYRLQIHVRDGRVRLYTMNGADWSKRYPLIVADAARIEGSAVLDAEVVWLDSDGVANFEALHSRQRRRGIRLCVRSAYAQWRRFEEKTAHRAQGRAEEGSPASKRRHSVRRTHRGRWC